MTNFIATGEDDILNSEFLFHDNPPADLQFVDGDSPVADACNDGGWSIEAIENLLLSDDADNTPSVDAAADAFLSDILVDSPSPPVYPGSGSSDASDNQVDGVNDPLEKKRKRQLRNKDAAVRSRERKKMYVKDLEMKSRFYEAECRRLGMMLQCCLAENHALRFSLHSKGSGHAYAASATMQESAVLLLESLLLGSLLWFLSILGLLTPIPLLLLILQAEQECEDVGRKCQRSLAPRKVQNDMFGLSAFRFFMMSKRWRSSRTRMKVLYHHWLCASGNIFLPVHRCSLLMP